MNYDSVVLSCLQDKNKLYLCYQQDKYSIMYRSILKSVIADNQLEVPKYRFIPRIFSFEEFGNFTFPKPLPPFRYAIH